MLNTLGLVAIILLNVGMYPQISRVVKRQDSQAISLLNLFCMCLGLGIMWLKASVENNTFFVVNYAIAFLLEIILLCVTVRYRR